MGVQVYHPYRQPGYPNYCLPFNGHCSHFCLPAPQVTLQDQATACKCPEYLQLDKDNRTCKEKGAKPLPLLKIFLTRHYFRYQTSDPHHDSPEYCSAQYCAWYWGLEYQDSTDYDTQYSTTLQHSGELSSYQVVTSDHIRFGCVLFKLVSAF